MALIPEAHILANPIGHWQQRHNPRLQSHAHEENVGSIEDITAIDLMKILGTIQSFLQDISNTCGFQPVKKRERGRPIACTQRRQTNGN